LPTAVSRKCAYPNDLPIVHADGNWQTMEGVLNKDMAIVGEYLQTWKLKLSTTRAMLEVFHLNNKGAKREVKVKHKNDTLSFLSELTYLGVTSDRAFTYGRHLESFRKELTSRFALQRQFAVSDWMLEQQRCAKSP